MNRWTAVVTSRTWLVGIIASLALAVAIALAAGCGIDVPLGVDPRSDAAVPADASSGGG